LERYLKIYNHHIPQKALGHKTPIQTLKKWQAEKTELFVKRVYNLAGLDSDRESPRTISALLHFFHIFDGVKEFSFNVEQSCVLLDITHQ